MSSIIIQRLCNIDANQITKSFIEDTFAAYYDKEDNTYKDAPFDANEIISLTPENYKYVKGLTKTTAGILLFNRYVLERTGCIEHTGYWNYPLTSKNLSKLNNTIGNLVIENVIDTKTSGAFVDARDQLGFWCSSFLSVSVTASLIRPMDNVNKRKAELFKENHDLINSDNPVEQIVTVNNIEKELVDMVKENLKDDPGYDLYASGDGNLANNYKTINVMRGAVYNNLTHKYDVVESSLMNGITKKDIPAFSNSVLAGAYPSAIGTAEAGYMSKKLLALLQSEHIDPDPKSDCGTQSTIPITVSESNKQYLMFRNIITPDGKRVLTSSKNIDTFVGQTVRMYSPMCCKQDAICGKCAGMVFHNLGVTRIGMLTSQITQKMLNLKLKSKHDLSQSAGYVDEKHLFANDTEYAYVDKGILKNKVRMKMFIPRPTDDDGKPLKDDNASGLFIEPEFVHALGVIPVKFYDNNDKIVSTNLLTIPVMMDFILYSDVQQDPDAYIITYEPESEICSLGLQKNVANVERFINQIYLDSKTPIIPYNMLTEIMFKCLEINSIDLTGPSIIYELLARRVCRHGNGSFAKAYANNPDVDQMSYKKLAFREAVQRAGALQGVLFQSTAESMNIGLAASLNGITPEETPLEIIIRS